jgi:hypothetical protein
MLAMVSIGANGHLRQPPLDMLRTYGQPPRGVGLSQIGAGGPPPPTETGAVSVAVAGALSRAQASPFDTNLGAQGTAANPPRPHHIDVRA